MICREFRKSSRWRVRQLALPLTRISILIDNGRAFCDTLGHGQLDNGKRAHFYAPIDPAPERNVG
jgi:hypothetical protein